MTDSAGGVEGSSSGARACRVTLRALGLAIFSLALPSCTSLSSLPPPSPVSAGEIVNAIECELSTINLLDPELRDFFRPWTAGATIELVSDSSHSITPGLDIGGDAVSGPIHVTPSGTLGNSTLRRQRLSVNINIRDLAPESANGRAINARCTGQADADGLGIANWLRQVADIAGDVDGGAAVAGFHYRVQFEATRSVGGGLTFNTSIGNIAINSSEARARLRNRLTIDFKANPDDVPLPEGRTETDPVVLDELQRIERLRELGEELSDLD